MLVAALTAPFLLIKIPKKTLFLVSGSIATLSTATGIIIQKVVSVTKKDFITCSCNLQTFVTISTRTTKRNYAEQPFMDTLSCFSSGSHLHGMFQSQTQP